MKSHRGDIQNIKCSSTHVYIVFVNLPFSRLVSLIFQLFLKRAVSRKIMLVPFLNALDSLFGTRFI